MIKYLFILINSITLFIYSLLSGGPITLTNSIPKNMKPGEEAVIEIRVNKGNMSGFAKLQLDLPEGFIVKEGDSRGANFSFSEGLAKWVWSSLPTDEIIVVKCTLIAVAAMSGVNTIGGKYSYVENNAKVVAEMEPVEVTVGEGGALAGKTNPPAQNTPSVASNNTNTEVSTGSNEPAGAITVTRTLAYGENEGDYVINLRINKGLTKGFARYSDDIASDMFAKVIKSEGASFSVSDGKVKFVWVAVPEKEIMEISYTMQNVSREITLNGEYSYLEQNQSKSYSVKPDKMGGNRQLDASKNTQPGNTSTVVANTNTQSTQQNTLFSNNTITASSTPTQLVVETNTVSSKTPTESALATSTTEAVKENTLAANNTPNETPKADVLPKKEGNIDYMVQIGAFTNGNVTSDKLSRKFNISENISSEMAGGFSKFMVGSHNEYKGARDHREKMRNSNGVRSAFVVAYNSGKRITVQEALMISNQKWFR